MTAKGPDHVSRGIRIPCNLERALEDLAKLKGISFNALVEQMLTDSWIRASPSPNPVTSTPHPSMQYFRYRHLPIPLQVISKPFGDLAADMDVVVNNNPQKDLGMQRLLEAKDCMVRANLPTST